MSNKKRQFWLKTKYNPQLLVTSQSEPGEPLTVSYRHEIHFIPVSEEWYWKLLDIQKDKKQAKHEAQKAQAPILITKHSDKSKKTVEELYRLLLLAKKNNDLQLGLYCLEKIPDLDAYVQPHSFTPYIYQNVDPEINSNENSKMNHPAHYKAQHEYNSPLLHKACEIGWASLVEKLIKGYKFKLDSLDHLEQTPLHLAAKSGNLKTVKLLIKRKKRYPKELPAFLDKRDKYGRTSLMFAAMNRSPSHIEVAKYLLEQGASLEAKDNSKYSALDYAAGFSNQPEMVELLIEKGARYNQMLMEMDTIGFFSEAYTHNWIERENAIKIFDSLQKINYSAINLNLVHAFNACDKGDISTLKKYLNHININEQSEGQNTLLHAAAFIGNYEIVKFLLDNGAEKSLSIRNLSDITPLMAAINPNTAPETIQLLLERGSDIHSVINLTGETALSYAIQQNLHHLFDVLVSYLQPEELIKTNIIGETYHHVAIKHKNAHALKYLLNQTKQNDLFVTKYNLSLLDYCALYFEEAFDILLPENTLAAKQLKSITKSNFIERAQEHIRTINNVLEKGILSSQEAEKLGVKATRCADNHPLKKVHCNVIRSEEGLAESLNAEKCGSLNVVVEREKNEEVIEMPAPVSKISPHDLNQEDRKAYDIADKSLKPILLNFFARNYSIEKTPLGLTKDSLYELTRRTFGSFLAVMSADKFKELNQNSAEVECEIGRTILPTEIELIILPEYLRVFKDSLTSKHCKLVFLDETQMSDFDENTIYVAFAPSKLSEIKHQPDRNYKPIPVCVYAPDYYCPSLIAYFKKKKSILTHIVRCETKLANEFSNQKPSHQENQHSNQFRYSHFFAEPSLEDSLVLESPPKDPFPCQSLSNYKDSLFWVKTKPIEIIGISNTGEKIRFERHEIKGGLQGECGLIAMPISDKESPYQTIIEILQNNQHPYHTKALELIGNDIMHLISSPIPDIKLEETLQTTLMKLAVKFQAEPNEVNRLNLQHGCCQASACLSYLQDDLMLRNWLSIRILRVWAMSKQVNLRIWQIQKNEATVLTENIVNDSSPIHEILYSNGNHFDLLQRIEEQDEEQDEEENELIDAFARLRYS